MDYREAPSTDHDLLVRIWTILEGTNGSGLITRFACVEKDMADIKVLIPSLWTKDEHDQSINEYEEKKAKSNERGKLTLRDWALIAMTIFGPIVAVVIAEIIK